MDIPQYVIDCDGDIVATDERQCARVGLRGLRAISVADWIRLYLETGLSLWDWQIRMAMQRRAWREMDI